MAAPIWVILTLISLSLETGDKQDIILGETSCTRCYVKSCSCCRYKKMPISSFSFIVEWHHELKHIKFKQKHKLTEGLKKKSPVHLGISHQAEVESLRSSGSRHFIFDSWSAVLSNVWPQQTNLDGMGYIRRFKEWLCLQC